MTVPCNGYPWQQFLATGKHERDFIDKRGGKKIRRRRQLLSLLIQIKRKLKRRRSKNATGEATYGQGASRPPRRFPRLRFCFRLRFNLRLIRINNESN